MTTEKNNPIKKVNIICAKGAIEDVYATLVMGNGAVMEGIEQISSLLSSVLMLLSKPGWISFIQVL